MFAGMDSCRCGNEWRYQAMRVSAKSLGLGLNLVKWIVRSPTEVEETGFFFSDT